MTRPSDPYLQAHTVAWIDEAGPRTATEWNRAASEVERLGWYNPAPAWARHLLEPFLPLKEERMIYNHEPFGYSFPVDTRRVVMSADEIRAEVARLNAEATRRAEARRPTPEGTAKLVREIFDRTCLLKPIVDSEKIQAALVEALEPIFTSTWARGFDDGQEQLRDDLQGVLDEV